jgi:AraC-like DNA-binding protein
MQLASHIQRIEKMPRPVATAANDYPPGHTIDWHDHPRAQLAYAERGVIRVATDQGVWITPPERAVWVSAGVRHRVKMSGNVRMHSLYVRADALPDGFDKCRVVLVTPLLRELIRAAVSLPQLYEEGGADSRLMRVLIDQLAGLDQAPLHLPIPEDARLKRVTAALLAALTALAGRAPVTQVALDLGYDSPSAFIAMFRRAFGVSPERFFQTPPD